MIPKHTNPTGPRREKNGREYYAHAPYNFIPLPEKIVQAKAPLDHDRYDPNSHSGWIDCTLETCSPTYVRGLYTQKQYKEVGQKKPDDLTQEQKEERAPFFSTGETEIEGFGVPAIPGSSLRGMIRALVEIGGHGRMRWVAGQPPFTFRAVAAPGNDPLRDPYNAVLGDFGRNVRAGYLEKDSGKWYIRPAKTPKDMGWPEKRETYLKIKERQIDEDSIPGFLPFNHPKYQPQVHQVSFDVEFRTGKRGRYTKVTNLGPASEKFEFSGVLVCSGNMKETAGMGDSPRTTHTLILEPNKNAKRLEIDARAIQDYRDGLTQFQKDQLGAYWAGGDWGCLKHDAPVFYVAEGNTVYYFGHCPNFRIPARLRDRHVRETRAATPADFVPLHIADSPENDDLADAIFGWVNENAPPETQQRAGRVFFEDAHFIDAKNGLWWQSKAIAPHTLAGPKPTTFQHYLVQDKDQGHDPDRKVTLAHYGTPTEETAIRGHKLYWHQGAKPDIAAGPEEMEHESQLTRVVPLKPGVRFKFRIRFENLRDEELGALLWALSLPGEKGKTYRHKLGMGKPLGMGAVAITPELHLINREERYSKLFDRGAWREAAASADSKTYIEKFEKFVLMQIAPGKQQLIELERMQHLFAMLEWRGDAVDQEWRQKTEYMRIEREIGPNEKINEYKERPVLPDPLAVVEQRIVVPNAIPISDFRTGVVEKFGEGGKSYGFIKPDGGENNIFVHKSQLRGGLQTLNAGDRVKFRVAPGKKGKGPAAKDVYLDE